MSQLETHDGTNQTVLDTTERVRKPINDRDTPKVETDVETDPDRRLNRGA
jgi:hypothetical protein